MTGQQSIPHSFIPHAFIPHAFIPQGAAVLTTDEMYAADAAAEALGLSSLALMEAAGGHVAREIRQRWSRRRTAVLCGPGNNGGDGFVIARMLKKVGWPVRVGLLGDVDALKGDAAANAGRWQADGGPVEPLSPDMIAWSGLVVDALFGAGLSRPLDGAARHAVRAMLEAGRPCAAVDVPSGVSGDTGAIVGGEAGLAPPCDLTVTFFRPKPGHLLCPGRDLCGDLKVVDIGIPEGVLTGIAPQTAVNGPDLWRIPTPGPADHKYSRGHAVVFGSAGLTGAARLGAAAARRVGAGLVTTAVPAEISAVYASELPGLMVEALEPGEQADAVLRDPRRNAALIGPGYGVGAQTRARVLEILAAGKATVLDADALTSFADDPALLFEGITGASGAVVLTPHKGEFARLFGPHEDTDRLTRARSAAALSGAVVLLKGSDTVIAAPDGCAAIAVDAPAWLATAGSGDVLAGLIIGLLAQGLAGWQAACAGTWLHSAAARASGRGMIAEDIIAAIPSILP